MKNILILDDNRDILATLAANLRFYLKDCNVMIAETSQQGLAMLSSAPVDLVLTDLDMPRVNGFQFIEEAGKCHPGTRVCVMSGVVDRGTKERLKALGITRMLEKPFPFDALVQMITDELGENDGFPAVGPVGCKDDPC